MSIISYNIIILKERAEGGYTQITLPFISYFF